MSLDFQDATALTSEQWALRERILRNFENAWRTGPRPLIEDYLPPAEPQRWAVLRELVSTDLEYRLKDGQPARVEDYLARYPGLKCDPQVELELIAAEWNLRRRREPGLAREEFLTRFPQHADALLA